jgi:uracil-DNA glycosylase family 4
MLKKPSECAGCPLETQGLGFSYPEGHGTLGVLMMGEALGENEARDGKPFRPYAQAGSLLERVIKMCGYDRMQFRLSNVIQCRPPRDFLDGALWELGAVNHCAVHRDRIVAEARPKVILALGGVPLRYLTAESGKNRSISYMRGYVLPCSEWEGIPVVPSFHPSFIKRGKQNFINVLAHDIRKAVAIAQGKFSNYALTEQERINSVTYITRPTLDDAYSYLNRAKENLGAFMGFDIETGESMFKDEDADDEIQLEIDAGTITQIQFSLGPGEAICMPWAGEYRDIAIKMLQLPHVKGAHNGWRFDLPVLRREGVRVQGVVHDTRWMWHHMQPDLPAHLQFVGSFFGMPFPWKHMASYDEEFYGCADADVLSRIFHQLPRQMEQKGVWGGYERQVMGLEPVLCGISKRGMPVDDAIRLELDKKLEGMQDAVNGEAQKLQPAPLRKWKVYKRPPKDKTGLVLRKPDDVDDDGTKAQQDSLFDAAMCEVLKWCRLIPFNIGSYQQLIEYMKYRKHPVPTKHKSNKETTELVELEKMFKKFKDPIYEMAVRYRNYQNLRGTFVNGWIPDADGFVHPSYTYGTAVGQLASKNPNGQNFPKRGKLAKELRRMIRAKARHKLVELDFSSFHAVTLAFEAQSKNWMRLARSDIHSFTTAHFLHLPERDKLLELPDDELKEYLAWVKKTHRETRDNKAKHAILGVGNGLGYRKLYRQYSDYFEGEKEAKALLDTIRGIFPEVFLYQNRRRREAHERTFLTSKFGYMRWFFDVMHYDSKVHDLVPGDDSEAALSFNHVNDAFGHIREQMLWLRATGYDEKWQLCNTIHDSLIFHCPDAFVDECVHLTYEQMTKRSPVLIDPVTAPTGLYVDAEASVGQDWVSLECVHKGVPKGLIEGPEGLAELCPITAWEVEAARRLEDIPF